MGLVLWAIGVIFLGIWLALRHNNGYWRRQGVPFIPATILMGNFEKICMFRKSVADNFYDIYNSQYANKSAAVGIHQFLTPALVVRDLDLVKAILSQDFAAFSNRQTAPDVNNDQIGAGSLFFVKARHWKSLRPRLTPFFTTGRIKQMFGLMRVVGDEFDEYLNSKRLNDESNMFQEEFRELFSRFTIDNIASCAFGIKANSIRNPDNEFASRSREMFTFTFYRAFEATSVFFIKKLVPWFRFTLLGEEANSFMRRTFNYAIDERTKSGEVRNDLIDILIALRDEDTGKITDENHLVLRDDVLVAQAATFFAAGYESTTTLMSFCLFELCRQPHMQQRIRAEIKEIMDANKGALTYESLLGLKYLGMVFSEVLRMYPPLPFLERECTIEYDLKPFSIDFKIPTGMPIFVPVHAIHRDPNFWPNPDRFDPERFSPENKDNIVPFSFIPFGAGPRNCIGMRFGDLQARLGLVNFFRNHRVAPSALTPTVAKFDRLAFLIQMEGGIHLNVIRDPL